MKFKKLALILLITLAVIMTALFTVNATTSLCVKSNAFFSFESEVESVEVIANVSGAYADKKAKTNLKKLTMKITILTLCQKKKKLL